MGLFAFLSNSLKKQGQKVLNDISSVAERKMIPVINIDGDYESQCYTYYGALFKGLKVGSVIYAEVVPGDTVLHSKSTGTTTSTEEMGCSALSYEGKIFAGTTCSLGVLKEIAQQGKVPLKVKLVKTGMYSPGIPEFSIMTADPRAIEAWWEEARQSKDIPPFDEKHYLRKIKQSRIKDKTGLKIGSHDVVLRVYPSRDTWSGDPLPSDRRLFLPTFEIIPTPAGSHAKPKIAVIENGKVIAEVNARQKAYKELLERVDQPARGSIVTNYSGSDDYVTVLLAFDN